MRKLAAVLVIGLSLLGAARGPCPLEFRNPFLAYFDLRALVHEIRAVQDAYLVPVAPTKPLSISLLWWLWILGWPEEALAAIWDHYELGDDAIESLLELIEISGIDDPILIARTLLFFRFVDENQVSLIVPAQIWMTIVPFPWD